jgi:hypothetical protein
MEGREGTNLKLLLKRLDAPPQPAPQTQNENNAELVASSSGRFSASKPQMTLLFRKVDGSGRGLAYSLFLGVEFEDPVQGFTIIFSGAKVEIGGRNLGDLLCRVCEHRQLEIVESCRSNALAGEPVCVESITFR